MPARPSGCRSGVAAPTPGRRKVVAVHDDEDGAFTLTAYFTSEEAARAGEREEPPAEAAELLREQMQLMQDVVYLDLREPWLHLPRS